MIEAPPSSTRRDIELRLLASTDRHTLLEFERDNRAWFERFIETRGDAFYSPSGVSDHIADSLDQYRQGSLYPGVLVDQQRHIVGRASLLGIDRLQGTAYVGYRIAEQYSGQGVASSALQQLKARAYLDYGLTRLTAFVAMSNPVSLHVLQKGGFVIVDKLPMLVAIQGQKVDCFHLTHRFACENSGPDE